MDRILGEFGCLIIERRGADVYDFLLQNDHLYQHRKSVWVIKQFIHNDISSTKIRLFIKRRMSIRYLLPDSVVQYIKENQLYTPLAAPCAPGKEGCIVASGGSNSHLKPPNGAYHPRRRATSSNQ
ncbi:MAG: hypothetical protein SGCHY_003987 [Lobulomycetales sp.]